MDLNVLFLLVIMGIVLVVLSRFTTPSNAFHGIFGYREAVWPTGVQEDDDAHWSWARARTPGEEPTEPPVPVIVDDDEVVELPVAGQVRYEVRSAVDRARS